MNDKLREALEADGCERIKDFYNVGPVQRAAVESFVAALTATQQAAPSQMGWREMQTPVAWVVRFNDPDPQIDIEFTQECPAGWVGRAEPLYEGPTVRNIELLHRAQRAEAQLAAILEASTQREQPAASKQEPQAQAGEPEPLYEVDTHGRLQATKPHSVSPGDKFITLQSHREAISKKDAEIEEKERECQLLGSAMDKTRILWKEEVHGLRAELDKAHAALDVCMAVLRTYDLIDTQAAAAITQAKEAMR